MSSKRWILVLALVLPSLGSCGGPEAIEPGTAEELQQQVRELAAVTQEGNFEVALDQAEALKVDVQQAQDSGAVTPGRAERIQANINAFIESIQPEDAPAPEETPAPVEAPAPVEPPAPVAPPTEPAPVPAPAPPAATVPDVTEDSGDSENTQPDAEREVAEEQQKQAEKEAEKAQKQAEKEAEKQQKQEEKNRGDEDD